MKDLFREIEREYENTRRLNKRKLDDRTKKVYLDIPEIEEIDSLIKNIGFMAAKEQILNPSEENQLRANEDIVKLRTKKELLLKNAGYERNYLDEIYTCNICKDRGTLENGKRCSCMENKLAKELYSVSNLSYTLQRENFNSFDLSIFSRDIIEEEGISPRDNMEIILKVSRKFIETFKKENDVNLLFYGPTGQGKTFMINCIAKELLDQNVNVVYQTAFTLCEVLEEQQFRRNELSNMKYKQLFNADLLIVDDLGIEMTNSFTAAGIFNIINKRMIGGKKTLISTNLSPNELSKTYTDRVVSRVAQKFVPIKFFGPDLRLNKNS